MVYWILRRLAILKFKAQVAMPAPKDFTRVRVNKVLLKVGNLVSFL